MAALVLAGCSFDATGLTGSAGAGGAEESAGETGGGAATGEPATSQGSMDPTATTATTTTTTATTTDETTAQVTVTMAGEEMGEQGVDSTSGESSGEETAGEETTGEETAGEASTGADASTGECVPAKWYLDEDGDGYGDPASETVTCNPTSEAIAQAGDCDDEDELVSPAAIEKCDNEDNDCDGLIDEYSAMNATKCGDCYIVPDDPAMATRAYYFCETAKSWSVARQQCQGKKGELVLDKTDAVHALLTGQLGVLGPMSGGWWIGGHATDLLSYKWVDGEGIPGNHKNWDYGKLGALTSRCVQLLSPGVDNGDHWTDRNCGEMKPYICEQPLKAP